MIRPRSARWAVVLFSLSLSASSAVLAEATPETRITVLSDAFSRDSKLELDWGYAALVEHDGKRILFDTGNNAAGFASNVRTLGIDLSRLDFVVISHRHGDHTDGLRHLLSVNPDVPIYVPEDEYFGGPTPPVFFSQPAPSLPRHMRYFGGAVPDVIPHGTPWQGARFRPVRETHELAPGIRLVANRAKSGPFSETPEVSLVLDTPDGPIVVVGCSHPGIERIMDSVKAKQTGVRLIAGGLHLVTTPPAEIQRVGQSLRTTWRVKAIAPGHCTGETAFAAFMKVWGDEYTYAGAGTVITVRAQEPHRDLLICRSAVPEPWLVPAEARIRERFDPACAAERRSNMRGTVAKGWIVVDGNTHAHLYMPWELMQALLLQTDPSKPTLRRDMYREELAAAGLDYDRFWQVLDDGGREFRTLWQSVSDDQRRAGGRLPQDDSRRTALCRARAAALDIARSAFGTAEFDRYLYTVVARNRVMGFNPQTQTPETLLRVENGCS